MLLNNMQFDECMFSTQSVFTMYHNKLTVVLEREPLLCPMSNHRAVPSKPI
jgi:hypothetical protein